MFHGFDGMTNSAIKETVAIFPLFIDELGKEAPDVIWVVGEPRRPPGHVVLLAIWIWASILHFLKLLVSDFSENSN